MIYLPCALLNLLYAQEARSLPEIRSEAVELVEVGAVQGAHEYTLTLPDRLRGRHFAFTVDRSVCQGDLFVNDQKLWNEDADEVFRFDRANRVRLEGCLERTPAPLRLVAHPKVFVERAEAKYFAGRGELQLELRIRNTSWNSAAVVLECVQVPGWAENFFLGPQTSQTRRVILRLGRYNPTIRLALSKFEEALEEAYQHIREVAVAR